MGSTLRANSGPILMALKWCQDKSSTIQSPFKNTSRFYPLVSHTKTWAEITTPLTLPSRWEISKRIQACRLPFWTIGHRADLPIYLVPQPLNWCSKEEYWWKMAMTSTQESTRLTVTTWVFVWMLVTICKYLIQIKANRFSVSSRLIFNSHCNISSVSITSAPSNNQLQTIRIRNYSSSQRNSAKTLQIKVVIDSSQLAGMKSS